MLPWIICGVLAVIIVILAIKIRTMQKSMDEICSCLSEHLSTDTNQLIAVSSNDKYVKHLANEISKQLAELRRQRQRYTNGDRELKEAVTNISHDLRTPLTAICGYLDLLENQELSENVKRYVDQIRNRSEVLKQLTEELFRYSVLSSMPELSYEKINLCRVLEETLLSFEGALQQANIEPVITMPKEAIWRTLDSTAVKRVFGNIINNAIKYSNGDFIVRLYDDGIITFTNTAKELSTVEVNKLFDRFYTVDSARKSTGLGLSIAKLLTERMNGSIDAKYENYKLTIWIDFNNSKEL